MSTKPIAIKVYDTYPNDPSIIMCHDVQIVEENIIHADKKSNSRSYEEINHIKMSNTRAISMYDDINPVDDIINIFGYLSGDEYYNKYTWSKFGTKLALTRMAKLYWNKEMALEYWRSEVMGCIFPCPIIVADKFIKLMVSKHINSEKTGMFFWIYKSIFDVDEISYWEDRIFTLYNEYKSFFIDEVLRFNNLLIEHEDNIIREKEKKEQMKQDTDDHIREIERIVNR